MYNLIFWNGEYGTGAEFRSYTVREYRSTDRGIYAKRLNGQWEYVGIGYFIWCIEKL